MTTVTEYDALIAEADADYAQGHFKVAHIKYGQAVAMGTRLNDYCRRMRGICSRLVADERMNRAVDEPDLRQPVLDQAANWLAKSEANLSAAFDDSRETELGQIRLEQAKTEESIARFMEMCGGDPSRRLSEAARFRTEAGELVAGT